MNGANTTEPRITNNLVSYTDRVAVIGLDAIDPGKTQAQFFQFVKVVTYPCFY